MEVAIGESIDSEQKRPRLRSVPSGLPEAHHSDWERARPCVLDHEDVLVLLGSHKLLRDDNSWVVHDSRASSAAQLLVRHDDNRSGNHVHYWRRLLRQAGHMVNFAVLLERILPDSRNLAAHSLLDNFEC